MQLTLFDAAESPGEKELKALDVNVLSPIEALNLLHRWKGEGQGVIANYPYLPRAAPANLPGQTDMTARRCNPGAFTAYV